MKKNLPITNNEITFRDDEEIISTTNLKGAITSFNDVFLRISGFSETELKGVNHNIVRHPDMPEAAFADLWQSLKAKKHWMGIVKNRCKNGDFYWVDAYVTPIVEKGKITGYESVRVKPSAERVARAEKVYQQINAGKTPKLGSFLQRLSLRNRTVLANLLAMISAFAVFYVTPEIVEIFPVILAMIIGTAVYYIVSTWAFKPLNQVVKTAQKEIDNPLT